MTRATVIDGKAIAARVRGEVAEGVEVFKRAHGMAPGLAVVLVGEDPASQVYVRNKAAATREAGMQSFERRLAASTGESALLEHIAALNRRPDVHGILVQLPLPKHIDSRKVIEAIDPAKDVDGFHPINVGRLAIGEPALAPCTPTGCVILARSVQRTRDLPEVVRRADLVVAAVGRAEIVRGTWIKPGAVVIDVGIQRVTGPDGKGRLVGDVAYAEAAEVAGAITPVPGGVGPMTVACLLRNTLQAANAAAS
jgi:methylenetetrahydrofolate dehydrogenase (NADP+)/methenyltetrahydrofolate cyclohydrolase